MKNIIRRWLNIVPAKPDMTEFEKRFAVLEEKLNWFMREYHTNMCVNCKRTILAHYGGFYRNSEGKVFCSSECIDKHKG